MPVASRMRFVFVVGFLVLANCFLALAQNETATLSGVVTDPKGSVVPGAEIMATRIETGTTLTTKTNGAGIYVFTGLMPGHYHLELQKPGFKAIAIRDIELHVEDKLERNFSLEIGSVSETVTVTADSTNINTTDGSVSTVVDQSYIKNMPLNGRSFQDLILLTPGVQTQTPQASQLSATTGLGLTGEFSVNGQRPESNYYTVDGASANVGVAAGQSMIFGAGASGSIAASTALGTTQALVSVDDLEEFRVQSSTYSAEYGRNPGGQFAFETKSGTNQWHGTAYDYVRNGLFDANDWFNDYFGVEEPPVRQNDFGGTLGGPVEVPGAYDGKDKTFFFVSYEGLRLAAPQPATVNYVPDSTLRSSAPADLQPALNAFPVPNGLDFPDGIAEYIASWSNPDSLNSTSVRFDHAINDKFRLFFRFSDTNSDSVIRGTSVGGASSNNSTPSVVTASQYVIRTYTAGANIIFSPRLSNEFRVNYTSNGTRQNQAIDSFGGSAPVDLLRLAGLETGAAVTVGLLYDGYTILLQQQRQSGTQRQWNFIDTIGLSLGRQQFKFGVDYRRLAPDAIVPTPSVPFFYITEASVEQNDAYTGVQSNASAHPLYMNFSAFAQDEWRVSQRLSLSVGLRWEVNPAPGVTQGFKPYAILGSNPNAWTLAPQGTPLWKTTWYDFAPRLGFAYILRNAGASETVVRAGAGVFFDTGQQLGSLGFQGPGFVASTAIGFGGSFPILAGAIPPIVNPPVAPYGIVYSFDPHLQLPYTLQWNASIEQAVGRSQALSLSYVGSHGSRLLQENTYLPASNPNAYYFGYVQNGLTSDYDSLQVQFRRRLSNGLTALASYTWSHCIDWGSQNYDIGYERGNCDFDVRDNFSAAFSYDLPNVRGNGFIDAVLHHWGLDDRFTARTPFPVTLEGFGLLQPNGQVYDEGLGFVPGQPIYLYGANCASVLQGLGDLAPGQVCPGGRAINPNAFVSVSSGLGDAPRNFAGGFGAWQMDLAMRRDFPIRERLKLQFRAEAFNVFNHPNFGSINGQFGTPTFGQATATLANSLGVLNPLYQMGGPRSLQFALKLVF